MSDAVRVPTIEAFDALERRVSALETPSQPPPPPNLHLWVRDDATSQGIADVLVSNSAGEVRRTSGDGHTHFPGTAGTYTFSHERYEAHQQSLGAADNDPEGQRPILLRRLPLAVRPGRVTLWRRGYVDDGGPFLSCDYTDMSGLRLYEQDRARYRRNCLEMRAYGATAHRMLGMVSWPGREIDPRRSDLVALTRAAIEDSAVHGGLRTRFTLFADCGVFDLQQAERVQHAHRIGQGLQGLEPLLEAVEVCNEPGHPVNGAWSARELLYIASVLREYLPTVVLGCGAPFGAGITTWTEEVYRELAATGFVFPHFERFVGTHEGHNRPVRQPWEALNLGAPFSNGEPIGPGSSVASEEHPGLLRAAATFTWMARGASYCYHTQAGIGQVSDGFIAREPGADVVFDGARILPGDLVQFQAHNWHWASNPWMTIDGSLSDSGLDARGSIRTISATHDDGRVATQVFRVTRGCTLVARVAMSVDVYHGGETGPYHLVGHERRASGERLEIPTCVDTLLIGRRV